MSRSLVVFVPTLNPGEQWLEWVRAVKSQSRVPDQVVVIDSGSEDSTCQVAVDAGFDVSSINNESFNHGGTRQSVIDKYHDYDFVVYLTQDAILKDSNSLSVLMSFFKDKEVAAVCGRQLPRLNASLIESHARLYNYASSSTIRSIKDKKVYGLKVAFLSNSFSAYRISALKEVGGFPNDVIFGEDMYVAAKMLMAGYKIAYAADACVYHSHNYTLVQEMKRYFDMGVFHAHEPWLRQEFGTAEGEGLKFVLSEVKYLSRYGFWRIPEAVLRTILKYFGFRLGLAERYIPLKIKRKISMNPGYFKI